MNKSDVTQGTVIGANVKLVGALKDVNDITVHGAVEGEVASEKNIIIGETANVKGPVIGATVTVGGTVRGSVEATNTLELLPTGKVFGNIMAKDLTIRSGAIFVGKSSMPAKEAKEPIGDEQEANEVKASDNKAKYEVE